MNYLPRSVKRQRWGMSGELPSILYKAQLQLPSVIEYNEMATSFINSKAEELNNRINEYIHSHKLDQEQADGYVYSNSDEYENLNSFFPGVIRYSILVSVCTIFESALTEICKEVDSIAANRFSDPKNKNQGISKAMGYLDSNFEIKINEHNSWQNIKDAFEIRNCVVHANGDHSMMREKKIKQIKKIILESEGLDLLKPFPESENTMGEIIISDSYLNHTSQLMISFLNDLERACIENNLIGSRYWP